ncbi:hypothetical protein ACIRG5_32365 [Lentzea sp. NPDC102401]|uniref:hypothetical protein n=1 Tax=Lentzea sp. NPDC102401 TaxID=3364128 RepID=UPI0038239840
MLDMIVPDHATRETVELVWQAVLDGTLNRAAAHRWAARWVEADDLGGRRSDGVVEVHTSSAVEEALTTWRAACANRPATTT